MSEILKLAGGPPVVYALDEGSGTSSVDQFGGRALTLTSSSIWSTDVPPFSGGSHSLSLDGSNYASGPDASLPLTILNRGPRTVACWAKTPQDSIPNNVGKWLVMYGTTGMQQAFAIGLANSTSFGSPTLGKYAFWFSCYFGEAYTTTLDLNDGQWHHYAITYDGAALTLYVDGNLCTSSGNFNPNIINTIPGGAINIGVWPTLVGSYPVFTGNIDDVRVYRTCLSSQQVQKIAGVHRFRMDDDVGHAYADDLSQALVFSGGPVWSNSSPPSMQGPNYGYYTFNGSDFLNGTDAGLPAGASPRTITGWYKSSSNPGYQMICQYGTPVGGQIIQFMLQPGGQLIISTDGSQVGGSQPPTNDGNWHFGAATFDGTTWKVYEDGALVVTGTQTTNTVLAGANQLFIAGNAVNNLIGAVDDVRIYPVALNASQIADLRGPHDEVQFIDNTGASSGEFQMCFNGVATDPLSYTANAAAVQTALEGTSIGSGNVSVTGDQATGYTVTFQSALHNVNVPQILVCGTLTSSGITSSTITQGGPAGGYFDPTIHSPVIVTYPHFGMYEDNTLAAFVTTNGNPVGYWLDACGSGNAWKSLASTYAQFTITPAETGTTGSYILGGGGFSPTATPTITGWTLTSGSTYNAGPFTFTCDTPGHQTQPSFDDSGLFNPWDGSIGTSAFNDGVAPYGGTAAHQDITDNGDATNGPVSGGTYTIGDSTVAWNASASPTNWSGSSGSGAGSFDYNTVGSGITPLGYDTSGLIGADSNPYDGTFSSSFTDGTDPITGVNASQTFSVVSAGSHPPSGGSWQVSDALVPNYAEPTPSNGWTGNGGGLNAIVSGTPDTFVGPQTSGWSPMTSATNQVVMNLTPGTPSFTDGSLNSPLYSSGDLDFTSGTAQMLGDTTISGFPTGAADRTGVVKFILPDWGIQTNFWSYGTGTTSQSWSLERHDNYFGFDANNAGTVFPGPSPDTTGEHSFTVSTTSGDFRSTTAMYFDGAAQSYTVWAGSGTLNTVLSQAYIGYPPSNGLFICGSTQLYAEFLAAGDVGLIG